jgi:hypothetical protein
MDRFVTMRLPINERVFLINRFIDQREKENEEVKKQSKKKR